MNRAEYTGQITYLMRHGRRVAAIVPIHLVPQESALPDTVTLYEADGSILIIARGDNAWVLGKPSEAFLIASFPGNATDWIEGSWAPEEPYQARADLNGLTPVAEYRDGEVHLLVERGRLG
ncbi:hypothetical protein J5X84_43570 [Streptosporangiaceae bacterium NEAU-GS5]|nr:hypothetical protein [Streptosporangiaceae bacterium NEAU-GS5]